MTAPFTPEVRDAARRSVLCWLATADAAGQPNVTPKELFAVVDDEHLVIANRGVAGPRGAPGVRGRARGRWNGCMIRSSRAIAHPEEVRPCHPTS